MAEYKNAGSTVLDLEGGQPLAPGEEVKLTEKEAGTGANKTYVDDGLLLELDAGAKSGGSRAKKGEEE